MTMTGYQLKDIGTTLSWGAVNSFLQNERVDSALMQELHPDFAGWGSTFKTNTILADIFDNPFFKDFKALILKDYGRAKCCYSKYLLKGFNSLFIIIFPVALHMDSALGFVHIKRTVCMFKSSLGLSHQSILKHKTILPLHCYLGVFN